MSLATDAPGLQLYTGNSLEGVPYRGGLARRHEALCLEAQSFPDALHRPCFPSIILPPGETYTRTIGYSFRSE